MHDTICLEMKKRKYEKRIGINLAIIITVVREQKF